MDDDILTPEEQGETTDGTLQPDEVEADGSVVQPQEDDQPVGEGSTLSLNGMFREYWIDYASDVILDRSVPDIDDGLKPVQRRILHAMKETDDGRFTKVANIVGTTMLYHPHGDASINDALVNLGQKNLLIDCQGNWGNILTGDGAAAGRYIEARLSKFAKEVVFNAKTTQWKPSYDGRKQEPVTLPIKFPLLLAQGTKGIAVTLTSMILPYNFCELLEASIKILRDEPFEIFPDFPTGGLIDVSRYNDAALGGRLRIRAKMHYDDKRKAIVITELPYTVTTDTLIDSILSANAKENIRIKKIDDNTAAEVEIVCYLPNGVSPDLTMDGLYAFTQCQISFSPQTCVIMDNKPVFMTASEILRHSTMRTRELLRQELEIQLAELEDRWHWVSLEKIFFEKGIYKILEKKDFATWEDQVTGIERGFDRYRKLFRQEITREHVLKLCEKPVRKISMFDIKKAEEEIANIEMDIEETKNHLAHLTDYAINYFQHILDTYGKGRERKTEIRNFEEIQAASVAVANEKLYVNMRTGFVGTGLKKEEGVEYAFDCSKMDDIIVFRPDGTMMVTKVQDKAFVGTPECKELLHVGLFRKKDDRTVYNMIYRDGTLGYVFVKRFSVIGITRDTEYNLTKGTKGTKVLYFTANPNGEAEVVTIHHATKAKLKKVSFDFDFAKLAIKGRQAMGNILTRNAVRNITKKGEGVSTLEAREIWFDRSVKRLNVNGAGESLGRFSGKDKIFTLNQSGTMRLMGHDLSNHFEDDLVEIRKHNPHMIVTVIYREAETGSYYIKRFQAEDSDRKLAFIDEGDTMIDYRFETYPHLKVLYDENSGKKILEEEINVDEFIAVKGYKAKGKRITISAVKSFQWLEPDPEPEYDDSAVEESEAEDDADLGDREGFAEGIQTELF
ncbi:MAG: DNA gyrase/topoisomerase IV subunit A [Bacteroidales bacterium]|nr:DNA gyrase/topoisomerase IV subunit A [Bacteroidales bacterium]